nr:unnamed protein product [uncultured bacterium]
MDISLCDVLQYIPPLGEELQHQIVDKNTVCLHSDVYILTRLSDMKLSQNMVDIITNRLQEVKDYMPDNLRQSFDKLNDFEKMDLTDSRYQQWLSDRVENTKEFISQLDSEIKKAKDSEDMAKLKQANLALRDFVLRLGSPDIPDDYQK